MTRVLKQSTQSNAKDVSPAAKPAGLPCPNSSASFWHSEPNGYLLGHRTTETLPKEADIVIVGSGITGASIARYLNENRRANGLSVVMLEAREACWGATGRNGGHCQPLLFDRTPEVAAFEVDNVEAVKSYIEQNSVPCEWRSVTGCRTFWDEKLFDEAAKAISALTKADPAMAKLVTATNNPADFAEHCVKPNVAGITLTKGAGQLWPYKYVTFIIEHLVKTGLLNLQTNTPVTAITRSSTSKGQTIHTARGTITARNVILATNGYTSHLLPSFTDLIVPCRCEMSALHPPTTSRLPNSYGMVGYDGGHPDHDDYLIQRPFTITDGTPRGGHLMFGGGRSFAMYGCLGETDDDIVDPGEADYLRRTLHRMLEIGGDHLPELRASHQWTGIKGMSRDNMPWVGKVPISTTSNSNSNSNGNENGIGGWTDGLWLCGGYSGHGMPNATLCGRAVVEMVLADIDGKGGADGDGGYEATCEMLVRSGGLPESYVITKERLAAAMRLPTVAEQEAV